MNDKWLGKAQTVIIDCFQSVRPALVDAFGRIASTTKSDSTIVTKLDEEIEQQLRTTLKKYDPGIGLVGEEQGAEGNPDVFWLIDPIDGTEQFVRGMPISRSVVTLIENGSPKLTLCYYFITDELYEACAGRGTFCNGRRLYVSGRTAKRSWIELSAPLGNLKNYQLVSAVRKHIAGYTVGRDFANAVTGKVEGILVYQSNGGDWDYAPRALLMQEAGAKVANIGKNVDGKRYDYKNHNFFAAAPQVFDELLPIIQEATR